MLLNTRKRYPAFEQLGPVEKNSHLRADVCKYRPEVGKIKFLKNPKKIV